MGQYSNKGLYNSYKKNNKERAELDYYATPTAEVHNILTALDIDLTNKTILEPCVGGGHMANGIAQYVNEHQMAGVKLIGSDIQDRGFNDTNWDLHYNLDFLDDDYPISEADIIIMNPPYATLEPFTIRALEIAKEKVIMLCRTQAIEGDGRYKNIYAEQPFTDMYQYINRIQCWRNGVEPTGSSAQAYCWLVWDKLNPKEPTIHWIKRID